MENIGVDEIRDEVNELVVNFVEKRIDVHEFRKGMTKFENIECFELLSRSKQSDLIAVIDVGSEILSYINQDNYHAEDPGSADIIIRHYYEELQKR